MKRKGMMVLVLVSMVSLCSAEVVFEEDFESAEDYQSRWQAPTGWSLVEAEIDGEKTTVLDVKGGGEGLSVQGGLGDFDYEADFRVVNKWGGFVFRARDVSNLYMLQFAVDDDLFYPHTRKNGGYSLVRLPFAGRIPLGQWRHIKFEIRGNKFKCFLGESPDRMEPAGEWEGKEPYQGGRFGFRCHGDEHIQVDNIQISTSEPIAPELRLDRSGLPRMIAAGQSFEAKVNVHNTGWMTVKNLRATLSLPQGLKLAKGRQTQSCPSLKTGAGHEFSWKVEAEEVTAGRMEIAVTCNELPAARTIPVDCVVNQALPVVSGKPAEEAAAGVDSNENVILENQNLRMVFVKNPRGYSAAVIYVYDGNKWRQVAVSQPIGHIAYRTADGQDVESDILPTSCEILDAGGPLAQVRFAAEKVDEDGCWWNFVYTFQVESGKDTVRTHYQAWANKDRQLLYFQGPDLYAGEGSFGSRKSQALLPGVEYLEAHERSSSDRDMVPALANRYAPHPYKLTIPLMAVEADNCLVGLMWDVLQSWDGERFAPSARFASPNFKDSQDNHLMGLFLPSIPEFVPENGDRAAKPYPLKANQKITLDAYIVADASAGLLDILDHYFTAYGMPQKLTLPITYDEMLELGRIGYMETAYSAEAVGTRHWEASPHLPYPGPCAILWIQSLYTKDPALKNVIRERIRLVVNKALEKYGMAGLSDKLDGRAETVALPCHVRSHLLPFYIGHLEGGLAAWKKRIYDECIDTQRADGSWEYMGQERCKQGDDVVIGTMAELTGCILKYARITGDERAVKAGLKALKFMERYIVPRGGQVWEVPKLTPDILPAGHATWAYLEGYQITGNPDYLERARYWAKTGVPFVYLWEAPDRPVMQYATIPVIGTTFYTHSWIGRPVQWCGLAYGYWLVKLSEFDQSFPWRAIGQGIMDSGIEQMLLVRDKIPGMYRDSLSLIGSNAPGGPAFEPETLMKPLFLMRGHGVEVNTKVLRQGGKRVHVSTGAILKSARLAKRGRSVTFELEYPAGEISYATVAGMSGNVKVEKDGRVLDRTDNLDAAGEGWKINADGLLLLKLKQDKPLVKINVTQK